MQFKWKYEPPTPDQKKAAEELGQKIGMNPILASLLIKRGITTESAAKRFFRPQLADLINPFLSSHGVVEPVYGYVHVLHEERVDKVG